MTTESHWSVPQLHGPEVMNDLPRFGSRKFRSCYLWQFASLLICFVPPTRSLHSLGKTSRLEDFFFFSFLSLQPFLSSFFSLPNGLLLSSPATNGPQLNCTICRKQVIRRILSRPSSAYAMERYRGGREGGEF